METATSPDTVIKNCHHRKASLRACCSLAAVAFWITGMKNCSKCNTEKPLEDFYRFKGSPDGRNYWCKLCKKTYEVEYQRANKEKLQKKRKEYRAKNRDRLIENSKKYREENPEKYREIQKKYFEKNRGKIMSRQAKYQRNRIKTDPAYALASRIRKRASAVLSGSNAPGFFRHMKYTRHEFVARLLSTLPEGYTEADACNGSKLHIDHIRPVSSFNLTGEIDDEFLACWSLDNLQLLPAEENLKKGNSLDWQPPSSDGEQLSWRWMA